MASLLLVFFCFFLSQQTKLICYPRLFNAAINYDAKTFWPLKKQTANNNNNNQAELGQLQQQQQEGPVLNVASTLLGQLLAFVTHTLSPTVSICISLHASLACHAPPALRLSRFTLCLYMGRVIGGHVNQHGSSRGMRPLSPIREAMTAASSRRIHRRKMDADEHPSIPLPPRSIAHKS